MKNIEAPSRVNVRSVLFLTDFSPSSAAAIPYAAEITKHFGSKLYALHMRPPIINPMTRPAGWAALEHAAQAEANAETDELMASFAGLRPEVSIKEGNFWEVLRSTIEEHKIDLIVMGTRGRSGIRKLLLGSKAEEVFRQAPCAVLTVGPSASALPAHAGEFTEIVYATDFTPESTAAAAHAISLAQEFQSHLTMLHVIAEDKPGDLVRAEEVRAASEHRLRKLVPAEAETWCVPRFEVEHGPVAETILEAAKRRKADLIVLGIRKPTGLPGAATHLPIATAHRVVSEAECPVLSVRG